MEVKLHDGQVQIVKDKHRFRIICAGRRFGKSVLSRLIVLKWAVDMPGLYYIVSPSYKQAKNIHWLEIKKEIPRQWIAKKNELDLSVTLKNGSIIALKGAENPDALRGVKLRGLVIDEIASIRSWDWLWLEVLRPTLTDYQAPAIFISTPKGFNHFYELFQLGQRNDDGNYKSWRFTTYDNPYIKPEEIAEAKKELAEDVFMQEYMADFRKYTGLVYKEFDRFKHVIDLPDFQPIYYLRGLDRGFTNPSASPVIAVNKDGDWYQTHELYRTGFTTPVLSEALTNLKADAGVSEFEYETMDSANAGDLQELNDLGHSFIGVKKEPGESHISYVRWKIQKFAERLRIRENGLPRYFVHPRCLETIREFESYAWPEKKNILENEPENPEKLNDHMMDALADLNAMYSHFYEEHEKKPWEGKIPGTFIPPSVEDEEENNWNAPNVTSDMFD